MTAATLPVRIQRPLDSYPEFRRYIGVLGTWLAFEEYGNDDLEAAAAALCRLVRTMPASTEEMLQAVRMVHRVPIARTGSDAVARLTQRRAHRYAIAVNQLLDLYYS